MSANGVVEESEQEIFGKPISDVQICFMSCPQDGASGFWGAALLTDARGRPLHFGYVTPVRPTTVQRILYGGTLDEHVKVDVIAKKLLGSLPKPPDIIFVDEKILIEMRRIAPAPTAMLSKVGIEDAEKSSISMLKFEIGKYLADRDDVTAALAILEQTLDMLDPFARIKEALKEAMKTK